MTRRLLSGSLVTMDRDALCSNGSVTEDRLGTYWSNTTLTTTK